MKKLFLITLLGFIFSHHLVMSGVQDKEVDFSNLQTKQKNRIWVDLERSNFYNLPEKTLPVVQSLISSYHRIEKTDQKNVFVRVWMLKTIARLTSKYLDDMNGFNCKIGDQEFYLLGEWYNSLGAYNNFYSLDTQDGFSIYTIFSNHINLK